MAFDFAAAEKRVVAEKVRTVKPLAAIVLGPSSSGKSFLMGTLGVKTLYLHTSGEEHGPDSAKLSADSDIFDIEFDRDPATGKPLGNDAAYKQLLEILSNRAWVVKMGFKAVAVDGATELESLIRGTGAFTTECLSKEGNHNGFAEPAATLKLLRPMMTLLRGLGRNLSMHYMVSCLLDIKKLAKNGEILESEPNLLGYKVASTYLPQFPDQIVVGRMVDPDGNEMHRLQFSAGVSKSSVDNKTKAVKKFSNFSPRLRGVDSNNLPTHMKADLKAVLKLKQDGKL